MIKKQQNDEPPLNWIDPDKMMLILTIIIVITSIAFVWAINHWAKVPEEEQKEISLSSYLIAQAPPYLFTEHSIRATLSAYNPVEEQCDSTPDITASGRKVREGYIANNCLPFGTIVKIEGKYYEVQDRMNKRYSCEYFDILMFDYHEAIVFGRQIKEIKYYKLVI